MTARSVVAHHLGVSAATGRVNGVAVWAVSIIS